MKYKIYGSAALLIAVLAWRGMAWRASNALDSNAVSANDRPSEGGSASPAIHDRKSSGDPSAAKGNTIKRTEPMVVANHGNKSNRHPGDLVSTPETVGGLRLPDLADGTRSPFAALSVAEAEAFTRGYLIYTQELKDFTTQFEEQAIDYDELTELVTEMGERTEGELRELLGPKRSEEFTQEIGAYFAKIGPEEGGCPTHC